MSLGRIRVVLVRPQHPGNVGAAARAMKNMGLATLVVVGDRPLDVGAAAAMAVHARDVLEDARTVSTFADAVADCGLVIGTCGRGGDAAATSPRALAPAIVAASAANAVALVFGPEDSGLANDELMRCHRVLTIPTADAYTSLNLAQAVLICAYELRLASASMLAAESRGASDAEDAATMAPLVDAASAERMYAALEQALRAIGFLHRDNGVHMMRALRRLLGRAGLDAYENRVLLGLARQIAWAAGRGRDDELTTGSDRGS